jgi:glycerophosphoryl diester phosphodiesterase
VGIYPETKHPSWHDEQPSTMAAKTTISDIVLKMLHK